MALGAKGEAEAEMARATLEVLAASIPDASLREAFTQAADRLLPPGRTARIRNGGAAWGGLTGREREVAALISRGHTNRQIATTLLLERRTVETHVGNILAKLGFSSRAQVIAWAIEKGLAARTAEE